MRVYFVCINKTRSVPLFHNFDMFSMMRRLSLNPPKNLLEELERKKDPHPYYNNLVRSTLEKKYGKREKAEKDRLEKSIAKGELEPLPGFEYIVEDPVYQ